MEVHSRTLHPFHVLSYTARERARAMLSAMFEYFCWSNLTPQRVRVILLAKPHASESHAAAATLYAFLACADAASPMMPMRLARVLVVSYALDVKAPLWSRPSARG